MDIWRIEESILFLYMEYSVNDILNDRTSGSSEILLKVQGLLPQLEEADSVTRLLKAEFWHFPVIVHFLNHIESQEISDKSITDYNSKWEEHNRQAVAELVGGVIPSQSNVLVHSNSGIVKRAILALRGKQSQLHVIQTESRPAFEGRIQGSFLLSNNISTELVVDAGVAQAMERVDFVLLGADMLLADGIVNKLGSLAISIVADVLNVPVYVIADERKRIEMQCSDYQPKVYDPTEICEDERYEMRNIYFEAVPNQYLTRFFL